MEQYYPRWQKKAIERALATRRAVILGGARQVGKTTLARRLESPDMEYLTLDDLTLKETAENDPHGFVITRGKTLIIDEIQRVPELLPAIFKLHQNLIQQQKTQKLSASLIWEGPLFEVLFLILY